MTGVIPEADYVQAFQYLTGGKKIKTKSICFWEEKSYDL